MLRDTGSSCSWVKYFDSTASALSIGSCGPSYRQDRMALGAGRLWKVLACSMALLTTSICATAGEDGPAPPGTL